VSSNPIQTPSIQHPALTRLSLFGEHVPGAYGSSTEAYLSLLGSMKQHSDSPLLQTLSSFGPNSLSMINRVSLPIELIGAIEMDFSSQLIHTLHRGDHNAVGRHPYEKVSLFLLFFLLPCGIASNLSLSHSLSHFGDVIGLKPAPP
jgi:hypothetical protein